MKSNIKFDTTTISNGRTGRHESTIDAVTVDVNDGAVKLVAIGIEEYGDDKGAIKWQDTKAATTALALLDGDGVITASVKAELTRLAETREACEKAEREALAKKAFDDAIATIYKPAADAIVDELGDKVSVIVPTVSLGHHLEISVDLGDGKPLYMTASREDAYSSDRHSFRSSVSYSFWGLRRKNADGYKAEAKPRTTATLVKAVKKLIADERDARAYEQKALTKEATELELVHAQVDPKAVYMSEKKWHRSYGGRGYETTDHFYRVGHVDFTVSVKDGALVNGRVRTSGHIDVNSLVTDQRLMLNTAGTKATVAVHFNEVLTGDELRDAVAFVLANK